PGEAPKKDERYAKPEGDVPVPDDDDTPEVRQPKRPRQDIVWVIDVTGSTRTVLASKKGRILEQVNSLASDRQSTRLGVVIFRGGHSLRDRKQGISVVPLTFDHDRVARYIVEIEARGTDDRGSAIPMAVHTALDQMAWREGARREVRLDLDGGCAKPAKAKATIARHFAHGTKCFVTYTLRSRRRVPEEVDAFAELGGTRGARILP
ncbi:MAG: hypothetical protein QNJ98_13655, partial [Planctomycetota bacterium]|nr:hypothetical protein [Planctomycetota bacterium]